MTKRAKRELTAIARALDSGDEILITQLDHEANRGPWLSLEEFGIVVKEILLKDDGTLDYEDLENKISSRTRLVAIGLASNALGTINQIKHVRSLTNEVRAWLLVDAVHYIPHFPIDSQTLSHYHNTSYHLAPLHRPLLYEGQS